MENSKMTLCQGPDKLPNALAHFRILHSFAYLCNELFRIIGHIFSLHRHYCKSTIFKPFEQERMIA
jgi:hypothetical protein